MPTMSFTGVVPIDFRIQGVPADTARIELSAGDTVIGVADAEPWTIPWDTSGYDGKITLTARSWDTSGNEGVAASTTVLGCGWTGIARRSTGRPR
jgi:hypothetical protein